MAFDDYNFRPITFQGVTFPATLMGIDILLPVLDIVDEDYLGDWILRLATCRGVSKRAPAERCAECARRAADLMLEHRQLVLDAIRDRLGPYGLNPEDTYRDWLLALQKIVELSTAADTECVWSAPSHPRDPYKTPAEAARAAKRFLDHLDSIRDKGIKFDDKEEPPPPQI